MEYHYKSIEKKWQKYWQDNHIFKADNHSVKPKYYVLDMFPYPSGAGLHVGHPLGYIASDIVSRFKRMKGFNVLHPMGYDSFGLPAEQYAIQTGQHPAITTENNIKRYREQLDNLGFSFDWSREVRTSSPDYYKFTQQIFLWLFQSWYNKKTNKAEPISELVKEFEKDGNKNVFAQSDCNVLFSADDWQKYSEYEKQEILLNYRLTYISETMVNWCPQLGSVLANEEVKDGVSERGGFPVERKLMKQWSMRITAYAERLLTGLEKIEWSDSIKEAQRNWIGKSEGCSIVFDVINSTEKIEVFTTRPDTIFGVTFLTLAPEHSLVQKITSSEQKKLVDDYVKESINRSERERQADVKRISGVFTGAFVKHPFNESHIPVWVGDYVLSGYGTGAVMAVPASDSRDYAFAKHFGNIPIVQVIDKGDINISAYEEKEGNMINSGFLNGLPVKQAIKKAIEAIENAGLGKGKVNYRLRDAVFSRQRYWGEPIPVYFKEGMPIALSEKDLPLLLPEVEKYLPTETGEPPLARAKDWNYTDKATGEKYPFEFSTMPGWAGSSWYFLRYMDAQNTDIPFDKAIAEYWNSVDLYIGGSEHATGHLLYSRFWTKFLFDIGKINFDEPFQKLINQGMIQGTSAFVYRINGTNTFVSNGLKQNYETTPLHVDVNIVENNQLNVNAFKKWRPEFDNAEFILEDDKYFCGSEVEKMSKSKWNVVNPDDIIEKYGADCLRMYEMFLGPLELSKPWNTNGITGVYSFLKKFWKLYFKDQQFYWAQEAASEKELKSVHKLIKKVQEDIERFSFNTSISAFMICVNELTDLKCNKKVVLEPLIKCLAPFAPHICEELWQMAGNENSISFAPFPNFEEKYLTESNFEYPVSVNGKTRFKLPLPSGLAVAEIEVAVRNSDDLEKFISKSDIKKVIVVPNRIINVVG